MGKIGLFLDDDTRGRLRRERERRGLSRDALAEQIGCSRNMLAVIELGKASPSDEMLDKLCAALGLRWSPRSVKLTSLH